MDNGWLDEYDSSGMLLTGPLAPESPLPPRLVGQQEAVPDWGILRWSDDRRKLLLQLVRETKGAEDPRQLQFAHEQRKVEAAKRHFRELGVDHRVVTDQTVDWWEPWEEQGEMG